MKKDEIVKEKINEDIFYLNYFNRNSQLSENKKVISDLYKLTTKSWGDFGLDFINSHVAKADHVIIAFVGNKKDTKNAKKIAGFAAVSENFFLGKTYFYYEFLIIDPEYQNAGLSKILNKNLFKKIIRENIFKLKFNIDLITISPNPIILGIISRTASKMYPDPKYFGLHKKLKPASEKIWKTAREIISKSYNPGRKIDRIGLVLHDSYKITPWLIYPKENFPKDQDDMINYFCYKFLNYEEERGDEFIIIAHYSFVKIIKFLFNRNE